MFSTINSEANDATSKAHTSNIKTLRMGEIPNWELFITYQNCYSRNKMVNLNRDLHFQFPS